MVMFARGAWNLVFNQAAKEGMTFASAYSLGRSMGLSSYRRAVMLGDYNVYRGWNVSQSWFKSIPNTTPMDRKYLGVGYQDQKQAYMYRVQLTGVSTISGEARKQIVTIHTDMEMTKSQLEAAAIDEYGSGYAAEVYAMDVDDATPLGGFARPF